MRAERRTQRDDDNDGRADSKMSADDFEESSVFGMTVTEVGGVERIEMKATFVMRLTDF